MFDTLISHRVEGGVTPNPWAFRMARLAKAALLLGADPSAGVCLVRLRTKPEKGIVGSGRPIGWRLVTGDGRASDFQGQSLAALDDVDTAILALLTALEAQQLAT